MSKQRSVDTCFWDDSYIVGLDPSEKLLFMYLLTNPLTSICGVYEIGIRRISFDTGFDQETTQRMLERFERDGRCIYREGWIAMRNWIKHQKTEAPGVREGIRIQLAKVPPELASYAQSYAQGVRPPSDPHLNLNLIKSNLNLKGPEGLTAAGPSRGSAAAAQQKSESKEEKLRKRKKVLDKQAKQIIAAEKSKKALVADDPF